MSSRPVKNAAMSFSVSEKELNHQLPFFRLSIFAAVAAINILQPRHRFVGHVQRAGGVIGNHYLRTRRGALIDTLKYNYPAHYYYPKLDAMGPFGSALLVIYLAVDAPTMILDGRDFYGRLVMPNHPNATWCTHLAECAAAIDRKYDEVNILFVNRCSVPAAKWWIRQAKPYRTLFVATDLDSYVQLASFSEGYTVVAVPFHNREECSLTYEVTLFRARVLCDVTNANTDINLRDPDMMPMLFGTGLPVRAQDMECKVPQF